MRARSALKYAGITVRVIEVSLKNKPDEMLKLSPKGTVPVLVLADGQVLEHSIDIMYWALHQKDPNGWLTADAEQTALLIKENDQDFKYVLDRYKYASRFPEQPPEVYRAQGEIFLKKLEGALNNSYYLHKDTVSLADIAIFPFVRQFASVDQQWFDTTPYAKLRRWLKALVESELFISIMEKHPT